MDTIGIMKMIDGTEQWGHCFLRMYFPAYVTCQDAFVDSFLCGPLDSSTARIGALDRMLAWHICPESLGMPCPALHALAPLTPPGHTHVFRVRLCSAFCTEQQSTLLLHFSLSFFVLRRVARAIQMDYLGVKLLQYSENA